LSPLTENTMGKLVTGPFAPARSAVSEKLRFVPVAMP